MQQGLSFVGLTALAPVPAQAAPGAAAAAGVPGLFQQLLQGALLGSPAAAGPAGPPAVPLPSQAQTLVTVQPQTQPLASPPTPGVAPLPAELPGVALTSAAPVAPVAPDVAPSAPPAPVTVAPPLPTQAPADEPLAEAESPPQTESAPAPPPVPDLMQMAAVASVVQAQAASPPNPPQPLPGHPPTSESDPAHENRAPLAAAAVESDPMVERFVQQVVRSGARDGAQSETGKLLPEGPKRSPTFADLIDLVQQADQPEASGEAQPQVREGKPERPAPDLAQAHAEHELLPVGEVRPQLAAEAPGQSPEPKEAQRPPVEPEAVVRQVAKSIRVMLDGKRSEIQLQLNPEHLGKIAVRLIISEGAVQANITARDASVRAALESGLEQLKLRFAEQGLKVEHVNVSVGGDSGFTQSQQSHQEQPRQHGQHGGRHPLWQARQEAEQRQQEPDNRKASPQMWGYGRPGSRINSLA